MRTTSDPLFKKKHLPLLSHDCHRLVITSGDFFKIVTNNTVQYMGSEYVLKSKKSAKEAFMNF